MSEHSISGHETLAVATTNAVDGLTDWRPSWMQRSLAVGAAILVVYLAWETEGLPERMLRDVLVFLLGPLSLGIAYGHRIGWRVDRRAVRNTVLLSAVVLPFYVIGSTLPSVRSFYPMFETSPAPGTFLPHALQLFVLALATETYFRGLLCVGLRDLGAKCVLISPVVYALIHAGKPPIELVLSGPTDVVFGLADYDANSILPSVVAHGGGLILLDWLVLHDPIVPSATVLEWLGWLPIPL